jgi:hypothetical protein
MRSLAQRDVLVSAGYAAVITCLACYPRLAIWLDRPYTTLFGSIMILWTAFVLWAFVFAWQPVYAHRPVIHFRAPLKLWMTATLFGVAWAVILRELMDPQLRLTNPKDYPADWHSWIAMCLFAMSLDSLFLCFAPYAFFIRLTRRPEASLALTVIFGIFVQYLKLSARRQWPPLLLVAELIAVHLVAGAVSVYFYLRGGALLVWWIVLIAQLRLTCDLLFVHG